MRLTTPRYGGYIVLHTMLWWPLVHPDMQEPRPTEAGR